MFRELSLNYLGPSNKYERELDNRFNRFIDSEVPHLSPEFGTRAPKGNDFQVEIKFTGRHYYRDKGGKRHSISNHVLANIVFGADDMISTILQSFDYAKGLNQINIYRLDPKRSYARIDARIHKLGRDAVKHIKKFFKQRPNPLRSNAESTIRRKGFDQYGVETGKLIDSLTYEVKYIGGSIR